MIQRLLSLPANFAYRVVFLERRLEDVQESQTKMVERLGTRGGDLPATQMERALEMHRNQVYTWLEMREGVRMIKISYDALIARSEAEALRVCRFPLPRATIHPANVRDRTALR